MRRYSTESAVWSAHDRNPDNWDEVSDAHLSPEAQQQLHHRISIVWDWHYTGMTTQQIADKHNVHPNQVKRLKNKCYKERPDGRPYGWLALIPQIRLSPRKGTYTNWFEAQPDDLQEYILGVICGKVKVGGKKLVGKKVKLAWQTIREECRRRQYDFSQYPFNTTDGGRKAFARFRKKLLAQDFPTQSAMLYGAEAGRLSSIACSASNKPQCRLKPYDVVQFDGHQLHTECTILAKNRDGEQVAYPMCKVWLLALIDVASNALITYELCLTPHNYSSDDLLSCIQSAFTPWTPRSLRNNSIAYHPQAGLPKGVIDFCSKRLPLCIRFDNARCQISSRNTDAIISQGIQEVVLNRAGYKRSNADVESWFKTFNSIFTSHLSTYTGSGPNDITRGNPEKAAIERQLVYEDLLDMVDVAICNYNATPSKNALGGLTPLEYIKTYDADREDFMYYVSEKDETGTTLYDLEYQRKISANNNDGHAPSVYCDYAAYTSPELKIRGDLIGEKVLVKIDKRDARKARLFLSNGQFFGVLDIEPKWSDRAHAPRDRCAIEKLAREKELIFETESRFNDYDGYMEDKQHTKKSARNVKEKTRVQTENAPSTRVDSSNEPVVTTIKKRRLHNLSNVKFTGLH